MSAIGNRHWVWYSPEIDELVVLWADWTGEIHFIIDQEAAEILGMRELGMTEFLWIPVCEL